jgi:dTDP-4-amino-4,6-dideoxygalactose transaminase
MEGFQGAILRVKLRHLEHWTETRRAIVKTYNEHLAGADVVWPAEMPRARHVYHLYTLRSDNRDALQAALLNEGIQTGVHYSTPVHLQPAYAHLGHGANSFPESEKAAREVLSLPLYPELTESQVQIVSRAFTGLV